jgi:hypothetical protein
MIFALLWIWGPGRTETPVQAPIEVVSATLDPVYDSLLKPQARGWLGADGATSVDLGNKKSLWLFGDTLLGIIGPKGDKKAAMVRNTIAIQDRRGNLPGTVEYFWSVEEGLPWSFFLGDNYDQGSWLWPVAGVMIEGDLYVFLYNLLSSEGIPGLNFKMGSTLLVKISNPSAGPAHWRMTRQELPFGGDHRNFISAVYLEKPYLYLLGFDDGETGQALERRAVLARISIRDVKRGLWQSGVQYWSEGSKEGVWTAGQENLKPLFSPGVTESSLHYSPRLKRYIALTQKAFEPDICIVSAPSITGPWSEPQKVYTIPELAGKKDCHAYAMKAHPELAASGDELVITYVVNTTDFWGLFSDLEIYYPRFVRVKLR